MGLYERADVQLTEAIQLASERNAKRVEMRAKLTQASLRVQSEQPSQALTLAAEPAKYFKEAGEARNTADANLIMSRAHSALDQFDEANTLARDVLAFAESANDEVRKGNALENLAGSLTYAGRLPEALAERERIDVVHRAQKDQSSLPKDLTNHAELLILLGRGRDADELLREVDTGIAAGVPSYVGRRTRVLVLRALLLSTQLRLAEANHAISEALTTIPKPAPGVTLNSTQMFAIVLAEYVRAQLGQSKQTTALIASWPGEAATPSDRREWSYWVARTLLSRGDSARAVQICAAILADPIVQADPELGWRLAAVAADAKRRLNASGDIGNLAEQARTSIDQIKKAWAGAAEPYLSRPDLAVLVRTVQ
jgi:tetratricopeptide (TPR) repeat protein